MRTHLILFVSGCWGCSTLAAQTARVRDPAEAGARYGEARGASELCPGFSMSESASTLVAEY